MAAQVHAHPEPHSTLEVHHSPAPEVDSGVFLPQPVPEPSLQAHHVTTPDRENIATEKVVPETRSRKKIGIIALVTFIIVAAVLGGALGGTLGRRDRDSKSSEGHGGSQEDPGRLKDKSTLYPNTSIAAVTLSNGDRRIYFQDSSGVIREAQYEVSTQKWTATTSHVVADYAKNGTSIAAHSAHLNVSSSSVNKTASRDRIGVAFTSRHGTYSSNANGTYPRFTLFDGIWVPNNPEFDYESTESTKLAYKMTQNKTSIVHNIFYQSSSSNSAEGAITRWSTLSRVGYDYNVTNHLGVPKSKFFYADFVTEGGVGFALSDVQDSIDDEVYDLYVMNTESQAIEQISVNLETGYCTEESVNCSDTGLGIVGFSDFQSSADMAVVSIDLDQSRLLGASLARNLSIFTFSGLGPEVASPLLQLSSPRLALTASPSSSGSMRDAFLYYQLNSSSLAEITFRNGYWNTTPSVISID